MWNLTYENLFERRDSKGSDNDWHEMDAIRMRINEIKAENEELAIFDSYARL